MHADMVLLINCKPCSLAERGNKTLATRSWPLKERVGAWVIR